MLAYELLPLSFEPNRGQFDDGVAYAARRGGSSLYLTPTEVVLVLPTPAYAPGMAAPPQHSPPVLRMTLVGASPVEIAGEAPQTATVNYLLGADPAGWHTNVPTYGRVRYRELLPGIDLVLYGNPDRLEYDVVVAPGADPSRFELAFSGADTLAIDDQGQLVLTVGGQTVHQRAPVVYQETEAGRRSIEGRYVLRGADRVGFEVAPYDEALALVIDPVLVYGTYLGGGEGDSGYGIAVDVHGNAYVTGFAGPGFPVAEDAFQSEYLSGETTLFVAKIAPDGRSLVYSTYIGGEVNADGGPAINLPGHPGVDRAGNVYVPGLTNAVDFPVTAGSFDPTYNGGCVEFVETWCGDGFLAVIDPTGSHLVYGTYIGGSGQEWAFTADVRGSDPRHALVAIGTGTSSPDFPTTPNAVQHTVTGSFDAAVVVLDVGADDPEDALVYASLLGGSDWDFAHDAEWSGDRVVTCGEYINHVPMGTFWHASATSETACIEDAECPENGTCLGVEPLVPEVRCGQSTDCPGEGTTCNGDGFVVRDCGDDPGCWEFPYISCGTDADCPDTAFCHAGMAICAYSGQCVVQGSCSGDGGAAWAGASADDSRTADWATPPGYGNNWDQRLTKSFALPDGPATIDYTARFDLELGYDYLWVEVAPAGSGAFEVLAVHDHKSYGFHDFSADIPEAYWAQTIDVRFRVTSDGAWSDEDALYPSDGAVHLDRVTVTGSPTDEFGSSLDGWTPSEIADGFTPMPTTYSYGPGGVGDGFVAVFEPFARRGQSTLAWNAVVGGTAFEWALEVAVDPAGNVYTTSFTGSDDLPTTPGAAGPTLQGWEDAYVAKFSRDGATLRYLTYIGGTAGEGSLSISADARGRAYVSGGTDSVDFPVTADALQGELRGEQDHFVAQLSSDGTELLYATYLGGSANEWWGLNALGPGGDLFVLVPGTGSDDMLTTGGFGETLRGPDDAYVARLRFRGRNR